MNQTPPKGFNTNSEERKAILSKIITHYCNGSGRPNYVLAFKDHPDWAVQLGWEREPFKGRAYAALAALRNGKHKTRNYPESRSAWMEEQVSLAREIMKNPAFQNGAGKTDWRLAMAMHPEWRQTLRYESRKAFMAFIMRVKSNPDFKGKAAKPESNGTTTALAKSSRREITVEAEVKPTHLDLTDLIEIRGQVYRVAAVAEKLEDYTPNLCPTCGLNIQALNHGYNIAVKASRHFQKA